MNNSIYDKYNSYENNLEININYIKNRKLIFSIIPNDINKIIISYCSKRCDICKNICNRNKINISKKPHSLYCDNNNNGNNNDNNNDIDDNNDINDNLSYSECHNCKLNICNKCSFECENCCEIICNNHYSLCKRCNGKVCDECSKVRYCRSCKEVLICSYCYDEGYCYMCS